MNRDSKILISPTDRDLNVAGWLEAVAPARKRFSSELQTRLHCGTRPALRAADRIHENWSIEILGRHSAARADSGTEQAYCLHETDSFRLVARLGATSIKGRPDERKAAG